MDQQNLASRISAVFPDKSLTVSLSGEAAVSNISVLCDSVPVANYRKHQIPLFLICSCWFMKPIYLFVKVFQSAEIGAKITNISIN